MYANSNELVVQYIIQIDMKLFEVPLN